MIFLSPKSYFKRVIEITFLSFVLLLCSSLNKVSANTSVYRSAGWVETEGVPAYSSIAGCQISNDSLYCSRPGASGYGVLYFGSFPSLDDFGIPLYSRIDKLHIKVRGKNSSSQLVSLSNEFNKKPFSSSCQNPPDLWNLYLGTTESIAEIHTSINLSNNLINCVNVNNINFRNLTFMISKNDGGWSADIDNFEIAFDYTPPAITPTPVFFPEGQKGTVWEVGPDKSELKQVAGLENIVSVAVGDYFSVALKSDGTVWTWTQSNSIPQQVKGENGQGFLTDVKKIVAGNNFGMVLKKDGSVWAWSQGLIDSQNPVNSGISGIVEISAGAGHKLALTSNGNVYGWGRNDRAQAGASCDCPFVYGPNLISNLSNVAGISAGDSHSLVVKKDGSVWGWGRVSEWQLTESGLLNIGDRRVPVQIAGLSNIKEVSSKLNYNLALDLNGEVLEWGQYISKPRKVQNISNVKNISAGWIQFSYGSTGNILKSDGSMWQLYINDIPPKQVPVLKNVVAVASGNQTASLAVVNTGDVLGTSVTPTPSISPSLTPVPGPQPFLDLPWNYGDGNFDKQVFNPESWFDHKYPLQNISCCVQQVLTYTGTERAVAYRSHAGYDYALRNGVGYRTPVLAAATGSAQFKPASKTGGLGNMIKIDHGNGYQTWYGHLDPNGLIISSEDVAVSVEKGQKIGETGYTGNIYPANEFGAHIHFGVFKDANANGNFNDDYPFGLVDPLGWDGKDKDPWTDYKVGNSSGSASIKLFTNLSKLKQQIISKSGGELKYKNVNIKFDPDTLPLDFTIHYSDGPFEVFSSDGKVFESIVPSFFLEAFNSVGDKISQFLKPVYIIYKYRDADLVNIKEESLKIYYYNLSNLKWEPLPSTVDLKNNIILTESSHFTQFAVMGEPKDKQSPNTDGILSGDKGSENWYRSIVTLAIKATDNEGGSGVENTLYTLDDNEWLRYEYPLTFEKEGKNEILFQSSDKLGNIEDVKRVKFNIDKTQSVTSATVAGAKGQDEWYISDVSVKLTAQDTFSGVQKTEYSTDGGQSYQVYGTTFVLINEGISPILYRSIDKAGNVEESKKLELKIDKAAPSTLVYSTGTKGQNDWYVSNVKIALNGKDEISGLKTSYYSLDNQSFIEYSDPIIFDQDGVSKVYYYSIDNAGNKEDVKDFEVKMDKTPPTVTIVANPNTIWPPNGKMVNIKITGNSTDSNLFLTKFNVKDEYGQLSPLLSGFGQTILLQASRNGSDIDGRVYDITATAEDMAGNKAYAITRVIVPHDQVK